jgi:isoleucyl-tRNA synthetase
VQKILAALKALDAHGAHEAATALHETGKLNLTIEGHQIELIPDELEVVATARPGFVAAEDRGYVVALETTITPELREEGLVRDLTHYVQDMRKRAGFNIEDHVALALYTGEDLASILRSHKKTLQSETLADTLSLVVDQPAAPLPDEVYREKIAPQELKKLENYTVEVVLGRV